MRLKRIYVLFFITMAMAGVFLAFMYLFKRYNSPNMVLNSLKESNHILSLANWEAEFLSCMRGSSCDKVGNDSYTLHIPDISETKKILAGITPKPDRVNLSYTLNEQELAWISDQRSLILVVATNVQNQSKIIVGGFTQSVYGLFADSMFFIPKKELLASKKIELWISFKNFDFFGPSDLPISFVNSREAYKFSSLRTRAFMTSGVVRAQQYTVFLVVAAMALILDHSLSFLLLALYALARGLRGFLPYLNELGFNVFSGQAELYVFSNIAVFVLLPLFLASVYKYKITKKYVVAIAIAGCIVLPYVFGYTDGGHMKMDLVADVISATMASFVVGFAAYKKYKEKSKTLSASTLAKGQVLKDSVYFLRSAVLMAALIIYGLANLDDLQLVSTQEFKDVLDWRHSLLLPTLVISALIEVGSMSKAMLRFGQKAVQQAILERDLDMGREVQREMLPVRRYKSRNWHWRAAYHPSATMAGDWFDIVELNFADGRTMLAAMLADITGHGISAAMMTSTVSSHWGLWLSKSKEISAPDGEDAKRWVEDACKSVHRGLSAMKTNRGASAACILFDPEKSILYYCTPGHPGILMQNQDRSIKYLVAKGKRLGGDDFNVCAQSVAIGLDTKICIFSDGIVAPETPVSQWIKRVERACRQDDGSLVEELVKGIKSNHKFFRQFREKEDDMTLLVLTLAPRNYSPSPEKSGQLEAASCKNIKITAA